MSNQLLAVRVGRVGDTVMMTPALTALTQYFPDSDITLLLSPVGKLLLNDFHPNIRNIWTWNRSGVINPILEKRKLIKKLQSIRFDKIFCFDTSHRIAGLFSKLDTDQHQYTVSNVLKHCAKGYLDFLAEVCDKPVVNTFNYLPVNEEMRTRVDKELAGHGISPSDKLLMIHPTFSGYSSWGIRKRQAKLRKLWAPENYGRVISKITNRGANTNGRVKVLMLLLPNELFFGRKIVKHSNGKVLLLKSDPNFDRYKAMIQRADVILTPDSGPMHIASALGTKILAFFSMKDPGDCGPYMNPEKFVVLRSENFPNPEKGINSIDVNTVNDALIELISR